MQGSTTGSLGGCEIVFDDHLDANANHDGGGGHDDGGGHHDGGGGGHGGRYDNDPADVHPAMMAADDGYDDDGGGGGGGNVPYPNTTAYDPSAAYGGDDQSRQSKLPSIVTSRDGGGRGHDDDDDDGGHYPYEEQGRHEEEDDDEDHHDHRYRYSHLDAPSGVIEEEQGQGKEQDREEEEQQLDPYAVPSVSVASWELDTMRWNQRRHISFIEQTAPSPGGGGGKKGSAANDRADIPLPSRQSFPRDCLQIVRLLDCNDVCVDCDQGPGSGAGADGHGDGNGGGGGDLPLWASISHGTLLCDKCAFTHITRSEEKQYKHMSQVKHLETGYWSLPEMLQMLEGGNGNFLQAVQTSSGRAGGGRRGASAPQLERMGGQRLTSTLNIMGSLNPIVEEDFGNSGGGYNGTNLGGGINSTVHSNNAAAAAASFDSRYKGRAAAAYCANLTRRTEAVCEAFDCYAGLPDGAAPDLMGQDLIRKPVPVPAFRRDEGTATSASAAAVPSDEQRSGPARSSSQRDYGKKAPWPSGGDGSSYAGWQDAAASSSSYACAGTEATSRTAGMTRRSSNDSSWVTTTRRSSNDSSLATREVVDSSAPMGRVADSVEPYYSRNEEPNSAADSRRKNSLGSKQGGNNSAGETRRGSGGSDGKVVYPPQRAATGTTSTTQRRRESAPGRMPQDAEERLLLERRPVLNRQSSIE